MAVQIGKRVKGQSEVGQRNFGEKDVEEGEGVSCLGHRNPNSSPCWLGAVSFCSRVTEGDIVL